jgi:hypothetical protein
MRSFFTSLLALSLVLGGSPCGAQVVQYVPAPQEPTPLPAASAYVAHVVDARAYRTALGYTRAGGAVAQPLMFREELAATVQSYFTRFAPGQPQAVPLVMRLAKLEATEDTHQLGSAKVSATLTAVFYAPQADGSYRAVVNFTRTLQHPIAGGPGAALVSHSANLGALFLSAAAVGGNQAAWVATGPAYSEAQVLAVAQATTAQPLLRPGEPRKPGFYHSWAEFSANNPSEPGVPEVEASPYPGSNWAGDEEIKPYRTRNGKRELALDVWGFSDGKQAYIRKGRDFNLLRPHDDDYVFFGRSGTELLAQSALNALGTAALISSGVYTRSVNPEHRALFRLSSASGLVSESQSMGTTLASSAERPAQLFIYRPRNAKGPAVRIRLSTGEAPQQLVAGDYLSFSPPLGATVTVYLVPATGPEIQVPVLATSQSAVYLECRPASAAPLRQVQQEVGADAVTRLVR